MFLDELRGQLAPQVAASVGESRGLTTAGRRFLDEMAYRYNNRKNPYLFRDTLLKLIGSESLEYKQLFSEP